MSAGCHETNSPFQLQLQKEALELLCRAQKGVSANGLEYCSLKMPFIESTLQLIGVTSNEEKLALPDGNPV